jgi:iron complex outermembrane receptor protein
MSAVRTHRKTSIVCTSLSAAVALALAGAAGAQETSEQASSSQAQTLDTVRVTGSRIKRTDVETALPVTVLQKTEIEAQGITSAEQLLMYLNIAGNGSDNLASNAGIVHEDQRGNNGVSGANLRGQGADATLVLLNGRRVATHGLKGRAVDLNSIPFAAIDRVEVLRDGASAIYGTDAIGGVINFITKSDYQGLQASTFIDATEEGGGNIYRANLLAGAGDLDADRWNVFGTVSFKKNEILRGTDRRYSNSFQPERGLSPDTRGTPFATVFNPAGSLFAGGAVDPANGETVSNANILDLPGGPGCEAGGPLMGPYDSELWGSSRSTALVNQYGCAWDYPAAAVIQQPQESVDFIARATFKISDNHQAFIEVVGSDVDVEKQFEPNQITSSTSTAETALGPVTWYPLNDITRDTYDMIFNGLAAYFGADQLNYGDPIAYRWRCMACGPRQISTNTKAFRFLAGFEGQIGTWDYSVGLSRATSESESKLNGGYHYTDAFRQVLGSGLINPFLMPGQSQSAEGMAALEAASATGVVLYGGKSTVTQVDATFSGELPWWTLPGGAIQVATGIDLRREEYSFNGDRRANPRPVFNAPFDNAANELADASRDVKAVFAELYLPLHDTLDVTIAGRYDRYDGFGSTTNPKYSFKWQPFDSLAFRGSYSTGFKVPSFNQLYNAVSEVQYTGLDLADPASCPGGVASEAPGCEIIRPDEIFGGNPNLAPEESEQKSVGLVFAPSDWFNLTLDWWEIERLNTIRTADRQTLIQYYDLFQDNWIRDASGNVTAIDRRYINSGGTVMSGIDVDVNFRIDDFAGGNWRINLSGTYLDEFKTKQYDILPYSDNLVGEYVRYYSLPLRWKHSIGVNYMRGDWTHSVTQIFRDGYKDEVPLGSNRTTDPYIPPQWNPDVSSYTTYNYSVSYHGFEKTRITFGIKDFFDKDPPFTAHWNDYAAGAGWEPRIVDPRGRAYTLMLEHTFW